MGNHLSTTKSDDMSRWLYIREECCCCSILYRRACSSIVEYDSSLHGLPKGPGISHFSATQAFGTSRNNTTISTSGG